MLFVEGRFKPEQQSIWTQLLVVVFPILLYSAIFMFFNAPDASGGGCGKGDQWSFW